MENLSLYDCDAIIQQIENIAESHDGIISESEIEMLVMAQTQSIEKLTKLVRYVKYLDGFQELAKSEIDRLQKQKKTAENRVESIKKYLLPYIQQHGPFQSGVHRISLRKSEGVVLDEGFNNPEYCKVVTTTTPDKLKIKESIRAGIQVEGAKLEQRENVQIK